MKVCFLKNFDDVGGVPDHMHVHVEQNSVSF
jgi:hypothetical protein